MSKMIPIIETILKDSNFMKDSKLPYSKDTIYIIDFV